jgi:hypothetical protein
MPQLTDQGQQVVNDLAQRTGFSPDAVTHMLVAVINGNGSMAQFSHPEFGGSGQWMRGGMTMVGDMFNGYLKGRVDSLCTEIANIIGSQPGLIQTGSFQSQTQSSGAMGDVFNGPVQSNLFVPDPRANWYPAELGSPNATGAQNNMRYAYFANARRLAVDTGGDVWIYDTLDNQIGGCSQQQGGSNTITFTSQYGNINLSSLPVVMRNGQPVTPAPAPHFDSAPAASYAPYPNNADQNPSPTGDIYHAIEQLGNLKAKGILSDDEFSAKKAELLSRI